MGEVRRFRPLAASRCKPRRPCENTAGVDSSRDVGAVESGMTHILGHDRSQLLLLPEAVDDYVSADNPVRFIEAFVDGLDLAALGFIGPVPQATGRAVTRAR